VAGSGQFVVNAPQRTCSGATFCDGRLEGLPFASQVDLVGVPEGDQCLHRLNAPPGVWQHDPNRPGGADFVGPLSGVAFTPGTNLSTTECGFQPMLRSTAGGAVELVKQDVTTRSDGELAVVTTCTGGTQRTDILDPEDFDDDNPCEANLSLLGWVNQVVIVNGQNTFRKVWKQLTKLVFPATQLTTFTGVDYTDGVNWRRAVFKKSGACMELGLAEADEAVSNTCQDYPSTGTTFPYLLACKDGTTHKVEPTAGKSLVGDGTNWQLRDAGGTLLNPRLLIGQKREGYTTSTSAIISGLVDSSGPTTGQTTGTYNMTAIPGYVAGTARKAKLRAHVSANTLALGGYPVAQVKVNDQIMMEASATSANVIGYTDSAYFEAVLTGDSFTFDLRAGVSNVVTGQAFAKIEVIGWE
jgi:hypothetical protein